ncbi:MAG TPA: hypothetical protein VK923_20860 [Euzebyales bacterium]|nr:hypothetical protein [Euzebyales bacterium]
MISDRQRALLRFPPRQILKRAAATGRLPDEQELRELSIDDRSRDRVREAARHVLDVAQRGGMRARHQAADLAERLAVEIAESVRREFADSVPVEHDDGPDSGELAERIIALRGTHPTSAESAQERATRLDVLRMVNHPRSDG